MWVYSAHSEITPVLGDWVVTERGHVHFVDGAGGGYTMAAKAMKAWFGHGAAATAALTPPFRYWASLIKAARGGNLDDKWLADSYEFRARRPRHPCPVLRAHGRSLRQ
jgi:hypothetical protein